MPVAASKSTSSRSEVDTREQSRQASGCNSSRETPVSSTEGDEEDEDEDEEDDDDEDDEDDEEVEGLERAEGVRFDEKFLAQLLAFDPTFVAQGGANKGGNDGATAPSNAQSKDTEDGRTSVAPLWPYNATQSSSSNEAVTSQQATESSYSQLAAPTPSNEFYDGAINFLTEVLGSSSSSFWSGGAGGASPGAVDLSWLETARTPAGSVAAPSPQPSRAQFKNLQPLISNLIARLKGLPAEKGAQAGHSLEDDLVTLLQSLMAHRQAQQDRQAQDQLGQSMAILQQSMSGGQVPQASAKLSSMFENSSTNVASDHLSNQAGFNIVDFDFGDDDDDPDFVPNTFNMGFSNSKELNDALAQASASSALGPMEAGANASVSLQTGPMNGATWQEMMETLEQAGNSAVNHAGIEEQARTGDMNSPSKRTRSASRNASVAQGSIFEDKSKKPPHRQDVGYSRSPSAEAQVEGDVSDTADGEGEQQSAKKRGRKALSKEVALERRRESNRECARRGRAKKKQEEEEIRAAFERIQGMRSVSREIGATTNGEDAEDLDMPAGLKKKKRGRPFGSKTSKVEHESTAQDAERVADLKADNRMLRAEMQRLIEENAQLRARMLRLQEEGSITRLSSSRRSRRDEGPQGWKDRREFERERQRQADRFDMSAVGSHSIHAEDDDGSLDDLSMDEEEDDEGFRANSLASRTLAYSPFTRTKVPVLTRSRNSDRAQDPKRRRMEGYTDPSGQSGQSSQSIERLIQSIASQQQKDSNSTSTASLHEILQKAAEAGLV